MKLLTRIANIADVKTGEYIRSRNLDGADEYKMVKATMNPIVPEKNQIEIVLENQSTITTSLEHPMLVYRDRWKYIPSAEVKVGDICQSSEGESSILEINPGNKDIHFCDFSVDGNENYYAGTTAKMMVVHNSATLYYPIWHLEVEDLLVLKNNKGTEDNRVRHMDYGVQFSKLFYERLIKNEDVTLFSPSDVPGLYEAFFEDQDKFKELYEQAERDPKVRKKTLKAVDLFSAFMEERKNTGRIYLMNVDHANTHSSFKEELAPIRMSNLCTEITLPTKPLKHIADEEGRIALCTLSAINWGNVRSPSDFKKPCELAVRGLDALLDYQKYPILAAELHSKEYRPLGIGIINLAYFLAKNDSNYSTPNLELVDEYAEAWSYYLIKASVELAKDKGACTKVEHTKYSDGVLPIDTYKRDVDELVKPNSRMDWDSLREDLKKYGIRNSTLMALMPAETSAQISNSTNGIEPPRAFVSIKQSKDGVLKQVVPGYPRLKNKYELLWDQKSPEGYLKIMAVLQKYIDQTISTNTSYNPEFYEGEKIPMSVMLQHLLFCYKFGIKTLYYFNTYDGQSEIDLDKEERDEKEKVLIEIIDDACEACVI